MKSNRVHLAPNYFFNPTHPITVSVIGIGGSGSLMLSRLARIDYALKELGHVGLHVTGFDDDNVELFNVGRQLFTPHDVGACKSVRAFTKINSAFSLQWKGIPKCVQPQSNELLANIIITCVDNAQFRVDLQERLKHESKNSDYKTPYYWLDLGNGKNIGQYVLGSVIVDEEKKLENTTVVNKLATIIDLFPNILENDTEELQGKGCSYRDKLEEQSLFINDVLTAHAGDMLFKLIKDKKLTNHGGFSNLDTGKVNPILV